MLRVFLPRRNISEHNFDKPMSFLDRVSLQHLKDGDEDNVDDNKNPASVSAKIDGQKPNGKGNESTSATVQHGSIDIEQRKTIQDSAGIEKDTLASQSQTSSVKTVGGLRRSLSDAADGSSSLDEKALAADEVEISLPNDKHRLSLTSALKSHASPVLKRRQTAFDSAIHNLLQEGKEFLHRKRQQVPLFGSHFANKMEVLPSSASIASTASSESSNQSDAHFNSIGSIVYRRKNDSVTLEAKDESVPDMEKLIVKIQSLPPMEAGDQLKDTAADLNLSSSTTATPPPVSKPKPKKAPSAVRLPTSLSSEGIIAGHAEEKTECLSNQDSILTAVLAPALDPSHKRSSSLIWKHYKEIIGVILVAATVAQFVAGYRSVPVFILGWLWGTYVTYLIATVIFWFCLPADRYPSIGNEPEPSPGDNESRLDAQVFEQELLVDDTIVYKGWMNRLPAKYDPDTYHINKTHSVLVRLDRNILRLSTPRMNVRRHAYCNEQRLNPAFISQEMFDMTGACVFLRPKQLAHRRWWSRKYPISIVFPPKERAVTDKTRRGSSPLGLFPKAQSEVVDESFANDTKGSDTSSQKTAGEVAVDALMEGVHGHDGSQLTDMEETDLDISDDEESETASLHSTLSLPSNLGAATKKELASRRSSRRHQRRRVINLFARSSREKENWFYRLRQAACHYSYSDRRKRFYQSRMNDTNGHQFNSTTDADLPPVGVPFFSNLSATTEHEDFMKKDDPLATEWILFISMQKQFEKHMRLYMPKQHPKLEVQTMDLICMMWKTWMGGEADTPTCGGVYDSSVDAPMSLMPGMSIDWVNAFASRMFYDVSRNPKWMAEVKVRIQRKLATLHLPYFIEMLQLTNLEPGSTAPRITAVNDPTMNEWGLWLDAKLEYLGGIRLVLETKVNLMKLKTEGGPQCTTTDVVKEQMSRYTNNDFPESPESSPDEDERLVTHVGSGHLAVSKQHPKKEQSEGKHESKGKKILHFVDKIAESKYFQAATENKYLKKLMQGVSETPLVLEVEVMHLCGALAVNIPPPPSDRLWYGFRFPPKVVLKARPRVGERAVNLSHVTDWIENKLVLLLEKHLVVPNMDDIIVPIMGGSPLYRNFNR